MHALAWTRTLAIATLALVITVAFQNCTRTGFNQSSSSDSFKSHGNGGNYDGKIIYLASNGLTPCADGSFVRARIDSLDVTYLLVRESCSNLAVPMALDPTAVTVDPTKTLLVYSGQTFIASRDPALQPFSSSSLWNTSIGDGAQWSADNDPDTIDLHHPGPGIAAGSDSAPVYNGLISDPVALFSSPLPDQSVHVPAGFHFSTPGLGSAVILDPGRRWLLHFNACSPNGTGYTCSAAQKDDVCADGMGMDGLGSGLIRSWELKAGSIRHMLRYALPLSLTKSGPTASSGLAWPATQEFSQGPTIYTGNILFGSTVGIPSNIDVSTLGLSPGGLALAHALQDYGALQRDNCGTNPGGIVFYAEEAAENLPALAQMRTDLPTLLPYLKIMRNQAASSPNGGGRRRVPAPPPLDPTVCGP